MPGQTIADINYEPAGEFQIPEPNEWGMSEEYTMMIEELEIEPDDYDIEYSGLSFEQEDR